MLTDLFTKVFLVYSFKNNMLQQLGLGSIPTQQILREDLKSFCKAR